MRGASSGPLLSRHLRVQKRRDGPDKEEPKVKKLDTGHAKPSADRGAAAARGVAMEAPAAVCEPREAPSQAARAKAPQNRRGGAAFVAAAIKGAEAVDAVADAGEGTIDDGTCEWRAQHHRRDPHRV